MTTDDDAGDATRADSATLDPTPESLDKVRDILFGSQMRSVDARLKSVEDRFQRDLAQLRADAGRQLADTEAQLRQQLRELGDRLAAESAERTRRMDAVHAELTAALRDLERRHVALEQKGDLADAELRDQLLQGFTALQGELAQARERLARDLENSNRWLDAKKADLGALATLFGDVTSRLQAAAPADGTRP
ncbi:MAG: hypothetical protein NW201_13460 [Gemmatimonadales bacterium]|nr:hypothetical protein [Gemmatimonadales bacterium]